MVDRLEEDHLNAKRLANGLSNISEINIDNEYVKTNILRFELSNNINQDQFTQYMKKEGVLFNSSYGAIRMVTNYGVSLKDIEKVIGITSKVISLIKK